tara:strand:- start:93 stop:521 length:429 start_codon:yes stop_codon:yes gene_type:complete
MTLPLFHLAIPVRDLTEARSFYSGVLGASEGRSDRQWVDFNFFGHQLVAHLDDSMDKHSTLLTTLVDGDLVPVPHFGLIVDQTGWDFILKRISEKDWPLEIPPRLKFKGSPGEQWTMFLRDPSGNAIEFKYFGNGNQVFAIK